MASYCTRAEATAAGATGTDGEKDAAIIAASERIDAYTGEWFDPRSTQTVYSVVGADGMAPMPKRIRAVTSVTYVGSPTALASTGYQLHSAEDAGSFDAIELRSSGYDMLVVGAEPWNGGWSNLAGVGQRIKVIGNFGYETTPKTIAHACALIAAHITNNADGDDYSGVKSLSVEGYSVTYDDTHTAARSTGVSQADGLLQPYRRLVAA